MVSRVQDTRQYLPFTVLLVMGLTIEVAANLLLADLAQEAERGVAGTEFIAISMLPYVLATAVILPLGLLTIAPWRRGVPRIVRLSRGLIIVAGITAAIFFFVP